ncbi:hypothetical protein C8D03_3336 [Bosea sp. 124]|nr:hypothetical protein C8D03_3336 [Bosea sp. 124]
MVERVVAHLPVLQENIALAPPFQIINGQSFSNAELSMRLAAISGPERDAVCVADNGDLWACGLAARATLSNLIQTTALNCDAVAGPRRHVEGSCRLPDKASLAARLVALGFARPAQPGHFEVELTEARRHRRGLWNGDWTVRAASPSFVAGQTLPSQASVP